MKPQIKLSAQGAAEEFGIDPRTMLKFLQTAGLPTVMGSRFTVRQVCGAVYGDISGARLRKTMAEADTAEMERDEKSGELLPVHLVDAVWTDIRDNVKGVILASGMTREEKHQVLTLLREIKHFEYREKQNAVGDEAAE